MTTQGVFRTQDPDVLTVREEWVEAAHAQREFFDSIQSRYGRNLMVRRSGIFGTEATGLSTDEADNERHAPTKRDDLPGLRLGAKEGYWVPDLRTAAGRKLRDEFETHRVAKPTYPGMPGEHMSGNDAFQSMIHTPGTQFIDGWVYVTWGVSAERLMTDQNPDSDLHRSRRGLVDLDVWEHVPLSQWYALVETREDVTA